MATSKKVAAKKTPKAAAKKNAGAAKARKASPMFKIGRSMAGNDLRVYTLAILGLLNMWDKRAVGRKLFAGFYMSKSILANHGGNGNLQVTADSVALTAQGVAFFNARIEDGIATKAEIASFAQALRNGDAKKLPEKFAGYANALYPHPASTD